MRWYFHDRNNPRESQAVARVASQIDAWWKAFQAQAANIDALFHGRKQWDLPGFMEEHLQVIHPQIMWEFGSAVQGPGHRLCITPEGERWLRPIVRSLVERAPKLPGWEWYDHRIPDDPQQVLDIVSGRTGVELSDIRLSLARDNAGRVDVDVHLSAASPLADEEQAFHAAFVTCESLFGEPMLEDRVGAIEPHVAARRSSGSKGLLTLPEAAQVMRELVREIEGEIPQLTSSDMLDREDAEWKLYELQSPENVAAEGENDFPYRQDLITLVVGRDDVIQSSFSQGVFRSRNFTRHGEAFAYLKIDGAAGLAGSAFGDREQIEEAIDHALRPDKLGCVIGGGTGQRYSYVDLSLLNVQESVGRIRKVLAGGEIPKRTWLLFFDDDLAAEWVGIYPDTPAPPGMADV